jgi:hypothetical protein
VLEILVEAKQRRLTIGKTSFTYLVMALFSHMLCSMPERGIMRVIFDSNAFVNLRFDKATKSTLTSLIKNGLVEVVGSCTFLEELSGIARGNPILYSEMFNEYIDLTNRKILNYANLLVQTEGEKYIDCSYDSSLLNEADTDLLLKLLNDPNEAVDAFNEIYSMKNSFKLDMEQTSQQVLAELRTHYSTNNEIIEGYRFWFRNIEKNANDFFIGIFNKTGSVKYNQLSHVSSYLEFSLVRIYERFSLGIPTKPSDLHDRAHFVDATVTDYLITDDKIFFDTCARVPHKQCDLLRFKDFINVLNYWHAA